MTRISRRIQSLAAVEDVRKQGRHLSTAPLGYYWSVRGSGKRGRPNRYGMLSIHPEKAEIVNFIFKGYASGIYTLLALAEEVAIRYNHKVSKNGIHTILTNKFYIGYITIGNVVCEKKDYPHIYPKLIDNDLFEKVQKQLRGNRHTRTKTSKDYLPYRYRSLMRCSECSCIVTVERHKGHVYYHCTQSTGKHDAVWINEKLVDELFNSHVKETVKILKIKSEYNELFEVIKAFDQVKRVRVLAKIFFQNILLNKEKNIEVRPYERHDILYRMKQYLHLSGVKSEQNNTMSLPALHSLLLNLCDDPITIDDLINKTGASLLDIQNAIIDMQFEGLVDQDMTGKWYKL